MPKPNLDIENDFTVFYRAFAKVIAHANPCLIGTGSGVVARALTWQFEEGYYWKIKFGNTKSYPTIYCSIFSNLRRSAESFKEAGIGQTAGKSLANMGVAAYIEKKYSHESSTKQGIRIAFTCPLVEAPVTVRAEYRKVIIFYNPNLDPRAVKKSSILTKPFGRVFLSTYVRLLSASIFTYGGTYALADYLRKFFPEKYQKTSIPKVVSSGICGLFMQIPIMPFVNWQTAVMENPNETLPSTTKTFLKKPSQVIWSGLFGRMICQGARYPLQFSILAGLQWLQESDDTSKSNRKHLR